MIRRLFAGIAIVASFLAATAALGAPAVMTSPTYGSVLGGSTVTFTWSDAGASLYQVWVGNSVGAYDIGYFPMGGTTSTSTVVSGLPTDGRALYVRLHSLIGGSYVYNDYVYTAAGSGAPPASTPAGIISPSNGSTLSSSTVTFMWNDVGASLYQVWVGNSMGAYDIGYFPMSGTMSTSTTVSGLPTDGRTLYVRLYSAIGGTYYYNDFMYMAASSGGGSPPPSPTPASITSPANGSTLSGSSVTFTWNDAGASLYQVWVGNSMGAYDIGYFPASGTMSTSTTVSGLPTDGRTLYVRLYSAIGGTYYYRDFAYMAASSGGGSPPPSAMPASITSPANGSTLSGSSATFMWNDAGAMLYQVWVGNSMGTYDIGYFPASGTMSTSTMVTGLPTDGRTLYVRLYSAIGSTWYYRDFTYMAAGSGGGSPPSSMPATMTSPANGSSLDDATAVFQWTAGGAENYQVWVGTTPGSHDVGYYPAAGTTGTSTTVTGLPHDGRTLYVRLWSMIGGTYYYNDYMYMATTLCPALLQFPADAATIPGPAQFFRWGGGAHCTNPTGTDYALTIGNTPGASDYSVSPYFLIMPTPEAIASGLPLDGRTLYATLRTFNGAMSVARTYTFTAAPSNPGAYLTFPSNKFPYNTVALQMDWNNAGADEYQLLAGSSPGAQDYAFFDTTSAFTYKIQPSCFMVPNYYVRLRSRFATTWYERDYVFGCEPM